MPKDYSKLKQNPENAARNAVRTLMKLYSDKVHFIDELIQNAEDSGYDRKTNSSKEISLGFSLRENDLLIWNSGRPFDDNDIQSICAIGESTKDLTEIGTFGIGFKAVYIFTNLPEIYSGDMRFYIRDYLSPYEIPKIPDEIIPYLDKKYTVFRLPFKSSILEPQINLLKKKLRGINRQSLLFFKNLKIIDWKDEEKKGKYYRKDRIIRIDPDVRETELHYKIISNSENQFKINDWLEKNQIDEYNAETWLIISKSVKPPDRIIESLIKDATDDEEYKKIKKSSDKPQVIDIAFRIDNKTKNIKKINNPVLFAYLPTEKETHLLFLLQARFQTTPARDNVSKDSLWNQWLVKEIANFIPEIFSCLKNENKINPSFFDILPISEDPVFDLLKPIVLAIDDEIKKGAYIPTNEGKLAIASTVFYPHSGLVEGLILKEELSALTGVPDASWLHQEIRDTEKFKRRFEVIRKAGVTEINANQVVSWCLSKGDEWIKTKEDKWLSLFYFYLSKQKSEYDQIKKSPILRLENGKHVSIQSTPAFFLPKDKKKIVNISHFFSEIPVISSKVLQGKNANEIFTFLQTLGVETIEPISVIKKIIIPKYRRNEQITIEQNKIHIGYLHYALSELNENDKKQVIREISETPIIFARSKKESEIQLKKPVDIYIPEIYSGKPLLEQYFENVDYILFIHDFYQDIIESKKHLYNFFKDIGCNAEPRIIQIPLNEDFKTNLRLNIRNNSYITTGQECFDNEIEGLTDFFKTEITFKKSKNLWRLLLGFKEKPIWKIQSYGWNTDRRFRNKWEFRAYYESSSSALLKEKEWLFDEKLNKHKSNELFHISSDERKLIGENVAFLHQDYITQESYLEEKLGIHQKVDPENVTNSLISISGKKIELEQISQIYQYLSKQPPEGIVPLFLSKKLIYTSKPSPRWWNVKDVFWENESIIFQNERGYLEKLYPEHLKGFFINMQVHEKADVLDYIRSILEIAPQTKPFEDKEKLNQFIDLYRRIWANWQEREEWKKDDHWGKMLNGPFWLGKKNNIYCFSTLRDLVIDDNDYIANLFKNEIVFWAIKKIQPFAEELGVEKCQKAEISFIPTGPQIDNDDWTTNVKEIKSYVNSFLTSPQWDKNINFEKLNQIFDQIAVKTTENGIVNYTLKNHNVRETEPIPSYFDEGTKILWIIEQKDEKEYPELIGDAFQKYFDAKELGVFIREMLDTSNIERSLKKWKRKGLKINQLTPSKETPKPEKSWEESSQPKKYPEKETAEKKKSDVSLTQEKDDTDEENQPDKPQKWTPQISADEIPVRIEKYLFKDKKETSKPTCESGSHEQCSDTGLKDRLTQDDKNRIGKEGEKYVVYSLKNLIERKYPDALLKEIADCHYQFLINKNVVAEIHRLNRPGFNNENYDIKLIDDGNTQYIEVKSTIDESKDWMDVSESQWKFAQEKGDFFSIYRVYSTGDVNARIEMIENPYKHYFDNEINVRLHVRLFI